MLSSWESLWNSGLLTPFSTNVTGEVLLFSAESELQHFGDKQQMTIETSFLIRVTQSECKISDYNLEIF